MFIFDDLGIEVDDVEEFLNVFDQIFAEGLMAMGVL